MVIDTYFHTNYASQRNYLDEYWMSDHVKISIVSYDLGMFCVIRNIKTGAMQCQTYPLKGGLPNPRNYRGLSTNGFYMLSMTVLNIEDSWKKIPKEKQNGLLKCLGDLKHSATIFCDKVNASECQTNEIMKHVENARVLLHELEMDGEKEIIGIVRMDKDYLMLKRGHYYPVARNIYSILDYRVVLNDGKVIYVSRNDVDGFFQ